MTPTEITATTEVSCNLKNGLQEEFERFTDLNRAKDPHFFAILHSKIYDKSLPMRAHIAYLLFKYLEHEKEDQIAISKRFSKQQLPFILEVIISIQYYHNQILDGKAGVTTPEKINDNIIVGNLLKDQLYRYIEAKVDLPAKGILKLTRTVRSIFEWVDIGQYLEKHCNTYEAMQNEDFNHPFEASVNNFVDEDCIAHFLNNIEQWVPEVDCYHHPFLTIYLQRIYLTNATLYKLTVTLIADLLGISLVCKEKLVYFITCYGMASQIMNDNCDFVPAKYEEATKGKKATDAFSDLRNKNVTLPIFIHLLRCPDGHLANILDSITKATLDDETEHVLFAEITEIFSIFYAMKVAKVIRKRLFTLLNPSNPSTAGLKYIMETLGNNRYYRYFYDYKSDIQKRTCYELYNKESKKINVIS